jgi:guanosine-3',5'-bis(diphosphate) 3'-pyrophosphohydrolase
MIRFEDLVEKAETYMPSDAIETLRRAYVFSAFAHKGQVRRSGEPYLVHPLEVAYFLADLRLDPAAIIAGLLHDVVEDTLTTVERIDELFGKEVAHLVEGVTKISSIRFASSAERQAESFRKMLLAMVDDIRVVLVKLSDRLHNMRTLASMPRDKQLKIASETAYLYAPLAHRLGLYAIKTELDDLSLKYTEPEVYKTIALKLQQSRRDREKFIQEFKDLYKRKFGIELSPKDAESDFPVKDSSIKIIRIFAKNRLENLTKLAAAPEEIQDLEKIAKRYLIWMEGI